MGWGYGGYGGWAPYVSVAERRRKAAREMEKLRKKGVNIQPVTIAGLKIARTFWGEAWCQHLENYSDYENRLPRGRTYVRNGSVCHLQIEKGKVTAKVSGSEIYDIQITIKPLHSSKWDHVRKACAGQVGSVLELLQGKLSNSVMAVVTDTEHGLFPSPKEISLDCSCPDGAYMCKHVAAVLYGVGARLDEKPELLFLLRGVDHTELVSAESARAVLKDVQPGRVLPAGALGDVFGIDLAPAAPAGSDSAPSQAAAANAARPKGPKRKTKAKRKPAEKRVNATIVSGATAVKEDE